MISDSIFLSLHKDSSFHARQTLGLGQTKRLAEPAILLLQHGVDIRVDTRMTLLRVTLIERVTPAAIIKYLAFQSFIFNPSSALQSQPFFSFSMV
jgi:menaquinone-dependent protoporphyrinogen IX oxidase